MNCRQSLGLLLLSLLPHSVRSDLKMVVVYGTPDATNTVQQEEVSPVTWTECVQSCYTTTDCAMVYRSGDGAKQCVSYSFPNCKNVPMSNVATGDRVAFKATRVLNFQVNQDETTCYDDPSELFVAGVAAFFTFTDNSPYTIYRIIIDGNNYVWSYVD